MTVRGWRWVSPGARLNYVRKGKRIALEVS